MDNKFRVKKYNCQNKAVQVKLYMYLILLNKCRLFEFNKMFSNKSNRNNRLSIIRRMREVGKILMKNLKKEKMMMMMMMKQKVRMTVKQL